MDKKPTYQELEVKIKELEEERLNNQKNFLKSILSNSPDELIRQKSLLKTIIDTSPDILSLKDKKFIYRVVNRAFCILLGKSEEEIIGKTDYDLFSHHLANVYRDTDRTVMESSSPQVQDYEMDTDDGKKWLHIVKTPLCDEKNGCIGIVCSIRDISEKMITAEEIRERAKMYQVMYQNLPIPYQSLDIEGNMIDINPAWINSLGYTREEVIGKKFVDFITPGYIKVFEKNFPKFLATGEVCNVPFKMLKKDDSYLYVELSGKIGYDEKGDFLQTHCVFWDVTAQKKMAEERESLIDKLRDTIDNQKTLQEMLPICSGCKKIRDDKGDWKQLENYITDKTGAMFSHSICPSCIKKLYPDYDKVRNKKKSEEDEDK